MVVIMSDLSAFPLQYDDGGFQSGMTLRDYFAAQAMQALIKEDYFKNTAKKAYEMADIMLRAREE